MQAEDKLFFIERMVPDGVSDFSWELYDSFHSEKDAYLTANSMNVLGWTVRVVNGNRTLHELVGA